MFHKVNVLNTFLTYDIFKLQWIYQDITPSKGLPWWFSGKEPPCNAGDWVLSLGQEDPLEKEMAIYSSILAWEIPWTEEPGRLQFMGS